jgi:hypothetical protein
MGSLLASVVALPSSVTVEPTKTLWAGATLATGGTLHELTPNVQSFPLLLPLPPQPASKAALNPKQTRIFILDIPYIDQ